ncbi:MAG: hypothetical protein ACJ8FY_17715 [Gemmataceae bacterium]
MTLFLVFLLVAAIGGLAFVGFHAIQLRVTVARLDADLAAQRDQYGQDQKRWNDYSVNVKAKHQALVDKYKENAKRWNESSKALKGEIHRLAKWKNVADAEVKAVEMRRTAQVTLEKAQADAAMLISRAQQTAAAQLAEADQQAAALITKSNNQATALTVEAKEKAKTLKDEAQAILDSVTAQAAKIIDGANKKAEQIAGSAYEAMKNATLYELTVKSMKNIIEGYGDKYIIPHQSLLDDLAEDFSHTHAGQELKRARECNDPKRYRCRLRICGSQQA